MLFFIQNTYPFLLHYSKFKYISCYSLSGYTDAYVYATTNLNTSHVILYQIALSIPPMAEFNLNTSHVILYQRVTLSECFLIGFKYISCYSLSHVRIVEDVPVYQFKYISCYSLSDYWTKGYHSFL